MLLSPALISSLDMYVVFVLCLNHVFTLCAMFEVCNTVATKAIGLIATRVQQEKEGSSKEREKEETHRGEETEVSRRTNCSRNKYNNGIVGHLN